MEKQLLRLDAAKVRWQEVDGEIMAVDIPRDEYLSLNATGAVIWSLLADGVTRGVLVDALVERFDVAESTARSDVEGFLDLLRERDLLC